MKYFAVKIFGRAGEVGASLYFTVGLSALHGSLLLSLTQKNYLLLCGRNANYVAKTYRGCLNFILLFLILFSTNIPAQDLCNEKTAGAEQGLCGKINGQNIYYEVWLEFDAGGFRKNVLFLRTDTIDISDSVSFCVDNIFGGNEEHGDSIGVSMTVNDTAKEFYTMNANDIPTVVQILDFHYGNEEYGGFNQGGSGYSIKIKGKKLYLTTLSSSSKYDATFEVKRKYKYRNGIFVPARTRYRKISDGYTLTGE